MLSLDDLTSRYILCGCLHVRTGAFFFGLVQVLYHVAILTLFPIWTSYVRFSKRFSQANYLSPMTFLQWEQFTIDLFFPQKFVSRFTFSSNDSAPSFVYGTNEKLTRFDPSLLRLITLHEYSNFNVGPLILSLAFAVLMTFGVLKGSAQLMLPYLFLQSTDFVLTLLSITVYFWNLPSLIACYNNELWMLCAIAGTGGLLVILKFLFLFLAISCFEYLAYFSHLLGFLIDNSIVAQWSSSLSAHYQGHYGSHQQRTQQGTMQSRAHDTRTPPTFDDVITGPSPHAHLSFNAAMLERSS